VNATLATVIEALRRSLRDAVQPELQSDHARSQLAGVLDILGKLERMTDWLPAMQQEEHATLRKGLDDIAARAAASNVDLPVEPAAGQGDALEACHERVRQVTDWLFAGDIAPDLRNELDSILRAALREALAAQRRRIPRADFSSMTASSE
jgi:hypothetical protein